MDFDTSLACSFYLLQLKTMIETNMEKKHVENEGLNNEKTESVIITQTNTIDDTKRLEEIKYSELLLLKQELERERRLSKALLDDLHRMKEILRLYTSLGNTNYDRTISEIDDARTQRVMTDMNRNLIQPTATRRQIEKNPHLDKVTLTKADILDIIAWALDDINIDDDTYQGVVDTNVKGRPDSVATKIASVLGELVYGMNNYIGPEKVGNIDGPLGKIAETVPALSEDDAAARAHDIALTVTDSAHVDEVLPPIAETAQVFRPLFSSVTMNRRGRGRTNQELLKLAGDIESNPGPTIIEYRLEDGEQIRLGAFPYTEDKLEERVVYWTNKYYVNNIFDVRASGRAVMLMCDTLTICLTVDGWKKDLTVDGDVEANPGPKEGEARIKKLSPFTPETGHTDLDMIIKNPSASGSYVNITPGAFVTSLRAKLENRGNVTLRSGADNSTDYALADCNWAQLGGYTTEAVANGAFNRISTRFHAYSWANRTPRVDAIPFGELGTGLGKSLLAFPDFISAQRTNTNAVTGDALLQLYSRTPAIDYGDYIGLAKLMLYSTLQQHFMFSGTVMDCYFPDMKTNAYDWANKSIDGLWPQSVNEAVGAPTAIDAFYVTQQTYADMILGNVTPPFLGMDESNTAIIPIDAAWPPETIALITMCHLEFPFFMADINASGQNSVITSAANAVATANSYLNPIWMQNALIRGPKFQVLFVLSSNNRAPIRVFTQDVVEYDPYVIVPPTNIVQELINFVNGNLLRNDNNTCINAFDYFARFATMSDWKAAVLFAGSLMNKKVPYYTHMVTVGGGTIPVPVAGDQAPTWNASIPVRNIASTAGRTQVFDTVNDRFPTYTQFMGVDYLSSGNIPGGGARDAVPDTGTYQNNGELTRYAQYIGILKKQTISGADINGMIKGNLLALSFAIWNASDICMDISGEWLIENGINSHMLHYQPFVAVSKRSQVWKKIASLWMDWQIKYTGIPFYRLMPPAYNTFTGGDLANYVNAEALYRAPLILTNRHLFDDLMQFDFAPTIRLISNSKEVFEYSTNTQSLIGPTNSVMGGNGALTMKREVMYETKKLADGSTEEIMRKEVKNVYAQSMTQHLANANVYSRWCSLGTRQRQNSLNYFISPTFMYFSDWMRLINTNQPTDLSTYSNGNRNGLGMSLPVYPIPYAPETGHQIIFQATQDGDVSGPRPMISIDGSGTYLYGTVQDTSVMSAFVPTSDPF
jgi:hypothetical protein